MARKLVGKQMVGYPAENGRVLKDWNGKVIGHGHIVSCSKVRPGMPGAWISSERCSYHFKVDGVWYAMRGRGDGIAAGGRAIKGR